MKKNLIVSMMLMGVLLSGCVNGKQYDVTEPSKYLISSEAGETKNTSSTKSESTNPTQKPAVPTAATRATQPGSATEATNGVKPSETTVPETSSAQESKPTAMQPPKASEAPHEHNYRSSVVAPTCTERGYTKWTCSCGSSYVDSYTAALGHNYTSEVVAPTTTEKGYTQYTCTRCGSSYRDNYTDPVPAETESEEVIDIAALKAYAREYAASQYGFGWDDSLWYDNAGYQPGGTCIISSMEYGYALVREEIDATYSSLMAIAGSIDGAKLNIDFADETYISKNRYCLVTFWG